MPEGYEIPTPTYTTAEDVDTYFVRIGNTTTPVTDNEVVTAEDDIDRALGHGHDRNDDTGRKIDPSDLETAYERRMLAEAVAEQVIQIRGVGMTNRAGSEQRLVKEESTDGIKFVYETSSSSANSQAISSKAREKLREAGLVTVWGVPGGGGDPRMPIFNRAPWRGNWGNRG
jgi:hypothetical protein